jgi:hypothetical protein
MNQTQLKYLTIVGLGTIYGIISMVYEQSIEKDKVILDYQYINATILRVMHSIIVFYLVLYFLFYNETNQCHHYVYLSFITVLFFQWCIIKTCIITYFENQCYKGEEYKWYHSNILSRNTISFFLFVSFFITLHVLKVPLSIKTAIGVTILYFYINSPIPSNTRAPTISITEIVKNIKSTFSLEHFMNSLYEKTQSGSIETFI